MLPDGWFWVDPVETAYPWRAESRSGSKPGLALAIEGDTQERVIDAAARIDAGFAAIPTTGWSFNHNHGFVP